MATIPLLDRMRQDMQLRVLYLVRDRHASRSTVLQRRAGLRFLVETTLRRHWPVLDLVRPAKQRTLPVVLTLAEVRTLLGLVRDARVRMCLTTIDSCGLRLSEGTQLTTHDIDGARGTVRVRRGKGGQDRYVPLAERVLRLLREYWRATSPRYPQPPGEQWPTRTMSAAPSGSLPSCIPGRERSCTTLTSIVSSPRAR